MLKFKKMFRNLSFFTVLCAFVLSCSNYDLISEKEQEIVEVYQPKTNVGKTLNAFNKEQEKAVNKILVTAQECYDEVAKVIPDQNHLLKEIQDQLLQGR